MKSNLPVIILRGIVLLPNNDLRLEFDNDSSKNIIDVAELFHDNTLLVISELNIDEVTPNNLPDIGVIAKITHKLELPNGKVRIVIKGLVRAKVYEYLNTTSQSEVLESISSELEKVYIPPMEEEALSKKLYKELENYTKVVPTASNSVLSLLINCTNLDESTDIVATNLSLRQDRLYDYLKENDCSKRVYFKGKNKTN